MSFNTEEVVDNIVKRMKEVIVMDTYKDKVKTQLDDTLRRMTMSRLASDLAGKQLSLFTLKDKVPSTIITPLDDTPVAVVPIEDKDNEFVAGIYDTHNGIIYLNEKQDADELLESFYHEFLHMMELQLERNLEVEMSDQAITIRHEFITGCAELMVSVRFQ